MTIKTGYGIAIGLGLLLAIVGAAEMVAVLWCYELKRVATAVALVLAAFAGLWLREYLNRKIK